MTADNLTSGPMIASIRSASGDCSGAVPGAMMSDQYRKPVRKTRTMMSSATVIAVSATLSRCGQATSAISGSADPHSCRMMCHLNQGSGVAAKELIVRPADLTDEPERCPRAERGEEHGLPAAPRRAAAQQHGQQRERRQQQADIADDQPGPLPIRKRADKSGVHDSVHQPRDGPVHSWIIGWAMRVA